MSEIKLTEILKLANSGTEKLVQETEILLNKVLNEKGADFKIGFSDTAYYLPFIYAATGFKVINISNAISILNEFKKLLPSKDETTNLEKTLQSGLAALACEEIIESIKYSTGLVSNELFLGFSSDAILREQVIKLVDGRMPAVCVLLGKSPNNEIAKQIVLDLQQNNILTFTLGIKEDKISIVQQLQQENIQFGWDTYLVPLGNNISSAIYAVNFAARAAMSFGGLKPGDTTNIVNYIKERIYAFVIALGEDIDNKTLATALGVLNFNIPIITDLRVEEISKTLVSCFDYEKIIQKSLEIKGVKIKKQKLIFQ